MTTAIVTKAKELDPIPQFKATAKLGEIPGSPFIAVALVHGEVSTSRPSNKKPHVALGGHTGKARPHGVKDNIQTYSTIKKD